jgi:hypothetical protein
MSSSLAKFGELTIRPSSLDLNEDEEIRSDDGNIYHQSNNNNNNHNDQEINSDDVQFSTIDLNGDLNGSSSPTTNQNDRLDFNKQPSINSNFTTNSSLGYTSFGEAFTDSNAGHCNNGVIRSSTATQYKISNNNTTTMLTNDINLDGNASSLLSDLNNNNTSVFGSSGVSMLSTAGDASTKLALRTFSTIELLKQWSKSAYKCTRQIVNEKLGKSNRTVDPELDASIEVFILINFISL